jgi:hypothetical protein
MRSSALDTLSRSCARRVFCWPAFPLVPALCSTGSAAGRPALFVGFAATTAEADFPRSCIIGYGSSPSRCGPRRSCRHWSNAGSPRFPRDPSVRDVAFDPGRASAPRIAVPHMLPSAVLTASAPALSSLSWLIPHTPHGRCVRFVAAVAVGSRNTHYRAARYGITRTGLSPVGLRQLLLAPSNIRAKTCHDITAP